MSYKRKGYNPKSLQNLKRMSDRTASERKKLGHKGGKKSAEAYARRHPHVVVIEKGCSVCGGSLQIKAETLEGLILTLDSLINERYAEYRSMLIAQLEDRRMILGFSLSMFDEESNHPDKRHIEEEIQRIDELLQQIKLDEARF